MFKQSSTLFLAVFLGSSICYGEETSENVPSSAEPPASLAITSLPADIQLIIGLGEDYYAPRVRAIHALGDELPADQVAELMKFLFQKLEDQNLTDLEFNGLKNELAWVLIRQRQKPVALADNLVKMYKDKSNDITWRDYCIQFCAKYYPYAPSQEDKRLMAETLFEATKERDERIAGTAGYMLVHMLKYPEFQKEQVQRVVYEAVSDPECSNLSKVALLQGAAELGDKRVLPLARTWANSKREMPLRMSAIAAIGLLGDKSDLPLLEPLAQSTDLRIQKPAQAAMEKINSR